MRNRTFREMLQVESSNDGRVTLLLDRGKALWEHEPTSKEADMDVLEKRLEKAPGLVLLFAITAVLLLEESSEITAAFRVFVVAWSLYALSSSLDRILFNTLYGTAPRDGKRSWWVYLRKKLLYPYCDLETMRHQAKECLHLTQIAGVYQRAKQRVREKDEERAKRGEERIWEKELEPPLFWSKFARSFVLPSLLIFLVAELPQLGWSWIAPVLTWLSRLGFGADFARARDKLEILFTCPAIPAIISAVSLFVYVALRIVHMQKLYQQVSTKEPTSSPLTS
jgi:hypothetical protein